MKRILKCNILIVVFGLMCLFSAALAMLFSQTEIFTFANGAEAEKTIQNVALSLRNDLVLKIETADSVQAVTVYIEGEGEEKLNEETIAQKTDGYFEYHGVTPQLMSNNVVITTDGTPENTETISVKEYCRLLLAGEHETLSSDQRAALKTLAADILNYGAAAQMFTAYNVDDLANAELSAEQTDVEARYAAVEAPKSVSGSDGAATEGIGVRGAGVRFDSSPGMYFTVVAPNGTEGLTLQVKKGDETEMLTVFETTEEENVYKAVYSDIYVAEYDTPLTVQVLRDGQPIGNVVTYSMNSYIANKASDPDMGALVKSMYVFADSAQKYAEAMMQPQKELIGDRVAAGEGWSLGNAAAGSNGAPDGAVWGSDRYWGFTRGGVSDGRYMYIVSFANWNARIIKLDGTTVIAASAQFAVGSDADLTRLMIKDGTLYCFINNGAVKTFDLSTFAEGCTPTDGTLPFGNVPGVVRDAEWNAEDRTYAVLDMEGNLYILSEDGEILKTNTKVASAGSRGWFEANSITSDERYVYVSLKYNEQDVIAVLVYDWDGNYIGEQVSYVNFNISENYNIQSAFMHGDEMYFTLWVNGSGSIHLWKLYMMN